MYRQQVSGVTYAFDGLVEVMAKATPLRSGDQLAGCAAEHDAERAAAAWVLADLPLDTFLNEDIVAYETDEVTRLIMDTHDRQAFSAISRLTVGGLRDWLLDTVVARSTAPSRIAAVAPGLTPEMVAAVSKIMRNQDLIAVSAATEVTAAFRTTVGCPRHAGHPAAAQPSDRRPSRYRRGRAGRAAAGLRRRGDRHQPRPRTHRRPPRTCWFCSIPSARATTSRRSPACCRTSPPPSG